MSHKKWDGIKKGLIISLIGATALKSVEKKKKKKYEIVPSDTLLLKYLERKLKVSREDMKKDILLLCEKLSEKNIFAPIDFSVSGDELYSNTLNEDIGFCMSAGLIEERKGSVIYQITDRGKKKINDRNGAFYGGVNTGAIEVLEGILEKNISQNYKPGVRI
ncbi:MAG: hypothetical protein KKA79_01960 [Nanoarchaeota archaeon]|nr:hypothetical protein [Nanoarchaeota archaeon]